MFDVHRWRYWHNYGIRGNVNHETHEDSSSGGHKYSLKSDQTTFSKSLDLRTILSLSLSCLTTVHHLNDCVGECRQREKSALWLINDRFIYQEKSNRWNQQGANYFQMFPHTVFTELMRPEKR